MRETAGSRRLVRSRTRLRKGGPDGNGCRSLGRFAARDLAGGGWALAAAGARPRRVAVHVGRLGDRVGWLLGALNATKIAGPAAIISWVVGAAAIMLLALIHAELGGMHAVNGGLARFPTTPSAASSASGWAGRTGSAR